MSGADGLKTGHTMESGYGLIGSVKRNNRRVTIVINGLNSKKKRTFESKRLFNIVFRETKLLSLFNNQKSVVNADVWLGKESKVNLIAEKPFNKIITPFEYNKTKVHVEWMNPLPAPILKGQKLGSIYISIPGKKTITENLVATKDVAKMSPFLRIKSIMKFLLYGEIVEN
jgi:D-alanyl-D-alanine carboxypeptidase (penicillin-binding protein 5/6)